MYGIKNGVSDGTSQKPVVYDLSYMLGKLDALSNLFAVRFISQTDNGKYIQLEQTKINDHFQGFQGLKVKCKGTNCGSRVRFTTADFWRLVRFLHGTAVANPSEHSRHESRVNAPLHTVLHWFCVGWESSPLNISLSNAGWLLKLQLILEYVINFGQGYMRFPLQIV